MGFLDKLLGREKKEDMPAEPQMRREGAQPDTGGIGEPPPERPGGMPPEPGTERTERETP
jgi:hypothetical protein